VHAQSHDLRFDEVGRRAATVARRGSKLSRSIVRAVRERRQPSKQKDDQDDEEDSVHRPSHGAIYETGEAMRGSANKAGRAKPRKGLAIGSNAI